MLWHEVEGRKDLKKKKSEMTSLHTRNLESRQKPMSYTNPPPGSTPPRPGEDSGLGWAHSHTLSGGGEVEPDPKGQGGGSQQGQWDWAES